MACCRSPSAAREPTVPVPDPVATPHCKSFFQWVPTDEGQLAHSERVSLAPIAGLYTQRTVAGLNTVSTAPHVAGRPTVVLLHGFAGGVATWVANWNAMMRHANVHALDMPGFARSERQARSFASAEDAISYFVSSLEAWFVAMEFDGPVVLAGHSFGGYVAAQYAVRHPKRVQKLLLLDPWGVNHAKNDTQKNLPFRFRLALRIFKAGNPLSILRVAGPWGPTLLPRVRKDFSERYGKVYADPMVFYNYVFHCNADAKASGEAGFKACSGVGPWVAQYPLIDLLPAQLPKSIPLRIVYGAQTWMDRQAGADMCAAFVAAGGDAVPSTVPHAAHQLMIDNISGFNDAFEVAVST